MRISTHEFNSMNVSSILQAQAMLAKIDEQVSTQSRINQASDDPIAATMVLRLNQNLANINSYNDNANFAQSRLSMENTVLQQAHTSLVQARTLMLQANNDTLSDSDRRDISQRLTLILDQLVDLANTKDGTGEYIFAGFFGASIPFYYDNAGKVIYSGSAGQRYLQVGTATQVAITDSGYNVFQAIKNGNGTFSTAATTTNTGAGIIDQGQIVTQGTVLSTSYTIGFANDPVTGVLQYTVQDAGGATIVPATNFTDGAQIPFAGIGVIIKGVPNAGDSFSVSPSVNQSMFDMLQNGINALTQSNPSVRASSVAACIQNLDNADDNLNIIMASIGARQNMVQNEMSQNTALSITTQKNISNLQNADFNQVISDLAQQTVSLQAAYLVYAKIGNMSLFNFIGK
jgi:flagellar hook-associated protein 3 FlgL